MKDNKPIFLILLLLFFFPLVFSQTEYEVIDEPTNPDAQQQQIIAYQEQIKQFSLLGQKIDEAKTQERADLEAVASMVLTNFQQNQSYFIVVLVVSNLASLGLWFAIFLYLKSRRLL